MTLRILNFGGDAVDTPGATGRLMLNMFAAMAQFEREMMLERQREGIAKAKAEGKYKGRKPTARLKAEAAVRMFRDGKRVAHIAKDWGSVAAVCIEPLRLLVSPRDTQSLLDHPYQPERLGYTPPCGGATIWCGTLS